VFCLNPSARNQPKSRLQTKSGVNLFANNFGFYAGFFGDFPPNQQALSDTASMLQKNAHSIQLSAHRLAFSRLLSAICSSRLFRFPFGATAGCSNAVMLGKVTLTRNTPLANEPVVTCKVPCGKLDSPSFPEKSYFIFADWRSLICK
jgi:hypothetical protein